MMRLSNLIVLTALLLPAGLVSCNKENGGDGGSKTSVTVTATMSKYRIADDKWNYPIWNTQSSLSMAVVGKSDSYQAKPLDPAFGLFSFKGVQGPLNKSNELLCWTGPDGARASYDGTALSFEIPENQDGTASGRILAGKANYTTAGTGSKISLNDMGCVMYIALKQGSYSITGGTIRANGGENIAGKVSMNPSGWTCTASKASVSIQLKTPIDCRLHESYITVLLAPVTLSNGYDITLQTAEGGTISVKKAEPVNLEVSGAVYTEKATNDSVRKLIACGSDKVYLIDATKTTWGGSYKDGLMWTWSCTSVMSKCPGCKSSSHIDDVVICNDKKQLLVTCSNNGGWCVLLEPDYENDGKAELLFWTNIAPNAHSAELLPGGYIAVACSTDGGDCVQIYDIKKNNTVKGSYPLSSAHGVVWNEQSQRLYAVGGNNLQIYKWNASDGTLSLEKTLGTNSYATGLHDISLVDGNTLIMGSTKCALYKINEGTFTQVPWFNDAATKGIKSLNYNPYSDEIFYTYAVADTHEGGYDWSTQTIRYTDTPFSNYNINTEKKIKVSDINMYKVRVLNW